jgi:nucleotide exchange factor SIL1
MIEVLDFSEQPKEPSTQENQEHLVRDASASLSDQEAFRDSFESLMTSNFEVPAGEGFWNLESLAHDIDFGVKIVQPEPLKRLLELARLGGDPKIRKCAIRIIGSSLWNNPKAMEVVKGTNLITDIIEILKEQDNDGVRASLIFSLSAAVAGEHGVQKFINAKGSDLFQEIFVKDDSEVQGKCATFVEDNLSSNLAIEGVDEQLLRWCHLFQEHLIQKPIDSTSEKVFSSLMFVSVCIN